MNYYKIVFYLLFLLWGIGHFVHHYFFKKDRSTGKVDFLFVAVIKQHLAAVVMIIFGFMGL